MSASSVNEDFVKIFALQLICAIACFCVVKFMDSPYQYIIGGILIVLSSIYSLRELDKRLNFKSIISKIKHI
jgi:hypothetical protein